ncbi:hypothetical protein Nepgr_026836 [Nepenthes gracilis]|uniref:Stigma-specific STIG1-like protein 1 n=1 Tax=Nepenthes gracilis TaxID=150966 RepID=A0AAD3T7V8_NEPGR|nr:hypothetical protein Nepgr_026836 [Nepenthes gracilis]
MKTAKLVFVLVIAMAMAIAFAFAMPSMKERTQEAAIQATKQTPSQGTQMPSSRLRRFLAADAAADDHDHSNPRASGHCRKDHEICSAVGSAFNGTMTCCNNKCFDLMYDKNHCGACNNKCEFTSDCCRGECVDKAYDKRHCGRCNRRCGHGQYCTYSMCDYA